MECNVVLLKVAKKVKNKKGEEITLYDFFIVLKNGSRIKILPNEYTDKKGVKHSTQRDLMLVATDNLPF